jgi:hypothetical protein
MRFFTSDFFPMNRPDSTAENVPKIAEMKLSSSGLVVADFRKNCNCGVAVAEQHFFKSCGIAIAEVLPSSCACPPLAITIDGARLLKQQKSMTVYCLLTKENRLPFSVSVCSKQTEVCRFRFL